MNDSKSSGNLSKGDVISFVALLLMGVIVFFGMNFMTLGDRIPSIAVAILTVVLMTVFVFLAAYAKAQDRNQSAWKKVQYAMLTLYILGLIPCVFFSAKFFDVQFDKTNIIKQVQSDTNDLNNLFSDYSKNCNSRVSAYDIELQGLLNYSEGRARIAELVGVDSSSVTQETVNQVVSSFSKSLTGAAYRELVSQKDSLVNNCDKNFNNWNILLIPQYANELGMAKEHYAKELEKIYEKNHNNIERDVPEFDAESYANESTIIDAFKSANSFSIESLIGLLVVLFLGILGLLKYLLGDKSTVVPMKQGDTSVIREDGGFNF